MASRRLAGLALAAAAATGFSASTRAEEARTVPSGADLYAAWCSNCHAATPDGSSYAPPLFGVIGRKAGGVEGYTYTPRITSLGIVWDERTLSDWLAGLSTESPTTSIRHLGIADAAHRSAVVAYIASLK